MKNPQIEIIKVKPKFYAQKCPNCFGYKTVSYGKKICPLCNGKGYLEIPVEEKR